MAVRLPIHGGSRRRPLHCFAPASSAGTFASRRSHMAKDRWQLTATAAMVQRQFPAEIHRLSGFTRLRGEQTFDVHTLK